MSPSPQPSTNSSSDPLTDPSEAEIADGRSSVRRLSPSYDAVPSNICSCSFTCPSQSSSCSFSDTPSSCGVQRSDAGCGETWPGRSEDTDESEARKRLIFSRQERCGERGESSPRGVFAALGFRETVSGAGAANVSGDNRQILERPEKGDCRRNAKTAETPAAAALGEQRVSACLHEESMDAARRRAREDCGARERTTGRERGEQEERGGKGEGVLGDEDIHANESEDGKASRSPEQREALAKPVACGHSAEDGASLSPFTAFLLAAPSECLDRLFAFLDFSAFFSAFATNTIAFSVFSSPSLLPQTWRRFALARKLCLVAVPAPPSWLSNSIFSADSPSGGQKTLEAERKWAADGRPALGDAERRGMEPKIEKKLPLVTVPCCLSRGDFLRLGQANRRWRLGFFSREQRISVFTHEPLEKAQIVACPPLFSSSQVSFSASPPFPAQSLLPGALARQIGPSNRLTSLAIEGRKGARNGPSEEPCPLLTVCSSCIYTADFGRKKATGTGSSGGAGRSQVCAAGEVRLLAVPASMSLVSPFPLLSGSGVIRLLHPNASGARAASSALPSPQSDAKEAAHGPQDAWTAGAGSVGPGNEEKQRKKKVQARRPPHVAWVPCLEHPLLWQRPASSGRRREDGKRFGTASLCSSPGLRPSSSPFLGPSSSPIHGPSSPFLGPSSSPGCCPSSSPFVGPSSSPFLGPSSPFLGLSSSPIHGPSSSPFMGPSPLLESSSFSRKEGEEIRKRDAEGQSIPGRLLAAAERGPVSSEAVREGRRDQLNEQGESPATHGVASASSLSISAPNHFLCLTLQPIDLVPPSPSPPGPPVLPLPGEASDVGGFNKAETKEDSASPRGPPSTDAGSACLSASASSSSASACASLSPGEGGQGVGCSGETLRAQFGQKAEALAEGEKVVACVGEKKGERGAKGGNEKKEEKEAAKAEAVSKKVPSDKSSSANLSSTPAAPLFRLHSVALCSLRRQHHASGPQVLHPHAVACCALEDEEALTIASALVWKRNTSNRSTPLPAPSRKSSFSPSVPPSSSSCAPACSSSPATCGVGERETAADASASGAAAAISRPGNSVEEKREKFPINASVAFVLGSTSGLGSGPAPVSFVSVIAAGTSSGAIYATSPSPCLVSACTCLPRLASVEASSPSQTPPARSFQTSLPLSSPPSSSSQPSSSASRMLRRDQKATALFAAEEASRGCPLQFVGRIASPDFSQTASGPIDFLHLVSGTPWSSPVLPSLPAPSRGSPACSPASSPLLQPSSFPSVTAPSASPVAACPPAPSLAADAPDAPAWHLRNWSPAVASEASGDRFLEETPRQSPGDGAVPSGILAAALWLFAGTSKGGGVKIFRWTWACSRELEAEREAGPAESADALAPKSRTAEGNEVRGEACTRCSYTGKWECMYTMAGQYDLLTVDLQWGLFALSTPVDSKILFLSFKKLLSHTQLSFSSGLSGCGASPSTSGSPPHVSVLPSSFRSSFCSSASSSLPFGAVSSLSALWSSADAAFGTACAVPPGGFPARSLRGFSSSPLMCPSQGAIGKIFVASPPTCLVSLGGGRWAAAVGRALRLLQVHYEEEKSEADRTARGRPGDRSERRRDARAPRNHEGPSSAPEASTVYAAPATLRCSSLCVLSGHDSRIYRLAFDGVRRLVSVDLAEVLIVWDTLRQRKLVGLDLKVKNPPLTASHLASLSALLPRDLRFPASPPRGPALTGADCAALSLAAQAKKGSGLLLGRDCRADSSLAAPFLSGTLAVVAAACAASEGRVMGPARAGGAKPRRLTSQALGFSVATAKKKGRARDAFCAGDEVDQFLVAQSASRLLAKENVTQRCRKVKRKAELWTGGGGLSACRDDPARHLGSRPRGDVCGSRGAETDSDFDDEEDFLVDDELRERENALAEAVQLQMEYDLRNLDRRRDAPDGEGTFDFASLASSAGAWTKNGSPAQHGPRGTNSGGFLPGSPQTAIRSLSASQLAPQRRRDCPLAASRRHPSTQSSWSEASSPPSPFQMPLHAPASPELKENAKPFSPPPVSSESYLAHFPPLLALPPLVAADSRATSREKEHRRLEKEKKGVPESPETTDARNGEGASVNDGSRSSDREPPAAVSPLSLLLNSPLQGKEPRSVAACHTDTRESQLENDKENRLSSPASGSAAVGKREETPRPQEKRKKTFAEAAAVAKADNALSRRVSPSVSAGQAALNSARAAASELFCEMLDRDSAEVLKTAATALGMSVDELYVHQMMELQRHEERSKRRGGSEPRAEQRDRSGEGGPPEKGLAETATGDAGNAGKRRHNRESDDATQQTDEGRKPQTTVEGTQQTEVPSETEHRETPTSTSKPHSSSSSSSSLACGPGEDQSPPAVAECLLSTLNGLSGVPRLIGLLGRKGLVWRQGPNSQARHIAAVCVGERQLALLYRELKMWQIWHFDNFHTDEHAPGFVEPGDL
ncbi:conserved hypothetical protein [Neospora caninum Liverpool]|uniref:RNA polymerase Rpb1 C-terminal repeat-containing protein n=1 Tax=Neospora caninum (strain Liverpool) TaxID=572307 RepID=F0VED9_NEOCL|nr:conserved hypothetical protein [Neospora caninum Liverpool]CBZ52083.1 conserved hypothetical protein [Neospora caninum Liverpool]CEL66045.1 TPA: RNA polymerase Rpb1 C-terminal repeat-containing protein [Neospora caninum Liverpool]|eukprot:XP_003882115.1 conserved hypothetical protein [Neospora caninum Liverpool]